jgi:putative Mg2+ transporter-C (MgtC) family protein
VLRVALLLTVGAPPRLGTQLADLGVALGFGTVIGLEREWREKNAGLRTNALVALGAAVFMLVSKYGFADVLAKEQVVLDPSRIAAQIVSGVGFLGAGVIFFHRSSVRGLTTAATIWLVAAIGAAAGAGLLGLASYATVAYLGVSTGFRALDRHIPERGYRHSQVDAHFAGGKGVANRIVEVSEQRGFTVEEANDGGAAGYLRLLVRSRNGPEALAAVLRDLPDVVRVEVAPQHRVKR